MPAVVGADSSGTGDRSQDHPEVFDAGGGRGVGASAGGVFHEPLWRARFERWFPELIDLSVRALTWDQIAVHHRWIAEQLDAPATVATIAQRLRNERGVDVSESTVRRYIAAAFAERHLEDKVTVPRGAVDPGSEAQIDYGRLGMWSDSTAGRRVAVWVFCDDPVVSSGVVHSTGAQDGANILERFTCGGVRVLRRDSVTVGV